MRTLFIAALAASLGACSTVGPPRQIQSPFNEAEALAMMKPGPNTITGSALLRKVSGDVVTCAGTPVVLFPATEYARERYFITFGDNGFRGIYSPQPNFTNPPGFMTHSRKATCNAQGFFRFDNLADGEYIITTTVSWGTPPYGVPTGGHLGTRAEVNGGRTVEVTLTMN